MSENGPVIIPLDLTGKAALISGASTGIGAATARLFAALGAKVAIGYYRNGEAAQALVAAITAAGGKAVAIPADLSRAAGARMLAEEAAKQLGPVDILVNNAGSLVQRSSLFDLTEERWDEVMDLNLKSALICTQVLAKKMVERRRGAIVNTFRLRDATAAEPEPALMPRQKRASSH